MILYSGENVPAAFAGTPYPGKHYEGCYINYPDKDLLMYPFWPQVYYGDGGLYPFLQNVKRTYDPHNVFHPRHVGASEAGVMELSRRLFVQSLTSVSVLAISRPGPKLLFAVNEVAECQGLPAGSVESYDVSGPPRLISCRGLSLSATMPKSLALAPDGSFLVVAAYGGGIYNVLPVSHAGVIGEVRQVLKVIGSSIHPDRQAASHPHSLVFHPSGNFLLATDLGTDPHRGFSCLERPHSSGFLCKYSARKRTCRIAN